MSQRVYSRRVPANRFLRVQHFCGEPLTLPSEPATVAVA